LNIFVRDERSTDGFHSEGDGVGLVERVLRGGSFGFATLGVSSFLEENLVSKKVTDLFELGLPPVGSSPVSSTRVAAVDVE
jgi:hypothetical protein